MNQQVTDAIGNKLGRGLKWPLELSDGKALYEENLDLLKQSIYIILNWYFGTRFYLGEFGSSLDLLLEEPNDNIVKTQIDYQLSKSLSRWEPRISLISTQLDYPRQDAIQIKLTYQINNTPLEGVFTYIYNKNTNY